MIRINLFLFLLLMLPAALPSSASEHGVQQAMTEQLELANSVQVISIYNRDKKPCRCAATAVLDCSASSAVALSACANRFDLPRKHGFSSLLETSLNGNPQQVPLPPPKV